MDEKDIRAFVERPRPDPARSEAIYWRERKGRLGLGEGSRIAGELWDYVREVRPDWSSPEERQADLEHHIRLGRLLRSVQPDKAS